MKGNSMKIHGWCDTRATHMTQENIHMKIVSGCPDTADDGYGSMGHAQLRSNVLFIDTMWNLNSANLRAWGSSSSTHLLFHMWKKKHIRISETHMGYEPAYHLSFDTNLEGPVEFQMFQILRTSFHVEILNSTMSYEKFVYTLK